MPLPAIPPGIVVAALCILITSQLLYVVPLQPRPRYPALVFLTGWAFAIGQVWGVLGLPAVSLGEANLVPSLLLALALRPLAGRLPV